MLFLQVRCYNRRDTHRAGTPRTKGQRKGHDAQRQRGQDAGSRRNKAGKRGRNGVELGSKPAFSGSNERKTGASMKTQTAQGVRSVRSGNGNRNNSRGAEQGRTATD